MPHVRDSGSGRERRAKTSRGVHTFARFTSCRLSHTANTEERQREVGSGERGAGSGNDAQWQNVVNAISDSSWLLLLLVATEVGSELTEKCQLNENFHKCVCECVCQAMCASVRRMFQIELCKTRDRA